MMDINLEAYHLGVREKTARNWREGKTRRPPYYDAALQAARADLQPASPALTQAMHRSLGVSRQLAHYWTMAQQTPRAARMAASWINYCRAKDMAG